MKQTSINFISLYDNSHEDDIYGQFFNYNEITIKYTLDSINKYCVMLIYHLINL